MSRANRRNTLTTLAALAVVLGAYTVVVAAYLAPRNAIANLDFWRHIRIGYDLAWGDPASMVDGLYPLGYPLSLRLATQAGIDALRFGQLLSWSGGLLMLASCFVLTMFLTRRRAFAIAGTALLLLNAHFLTYATYEGNDMIAAGLQAAAVVAVWFATSRGQVPRHSGQAAAADEPARGAGTEAELESPGGAPVSGGDVPDSPGGVPDSPGSVPGLQPGLQTASQSPHTDPSGFSPLWLALAGVLLGLAYLTRYTALIMAVVLLIYLAVLYRRTPRRALTGAAWLLAAFAVVTAVQLVPSWQAHGNPLYNEQAKNVWFGIYGQGDWVHNWPKVPDSIPLREVIAIDPARFLDHWLHQLRSAFTSPLWPLPLHIAALLAIPALLLSRRPSAARRLLLLMTLLVPLAVTALAWLAPRFFLVPLWIEAVLIAWLAYRLVQVVPWERLARAAHRTADGGTSTGSRWPHGEIRHGEIPYAAVASLLLVAAFGLQLPAAIEWFSEPPMTRPVEVNDFLRLAGMEDPRRVATNDPYLHAADEATRTRYVQIYAVDPKPDSAEALLANPLAADWQYLVLDYRNGFGSYDDLRNEFREARDSLAPLALSEDRDVFCVVPCAADQATPAGITFENGMRLTGYGVNTAAGEGSLYLYWQADEPLSRSYKVSVRVLDASGRELVQVDSVPQLWTYPTTAWEPRKTVVDFYSWSIDEDTRRQDGSSPRQDEDPVGQDDDPRRQDADRRPSRSRCEGCSVALLVYDEETLEPSLAVTAEGRQVGPLVKLADLP